LQAVSGTSRSEAGSGLKESLRQGLAPCYKQPMDGGDVACPNCRARPLIEVSGVDELEGVWAVEARVHTIDASEYRSQRRVLVVSWPHCRTVLGSFAPTSG
jgi:hypothetical protein